MEKKEITISPRKPVVFDFGTMTNIEVNPYLSIDNRRKIAETYLASFFEKNEEGEFVLNEFQAEYALVLAITDLCTNLSIDFSGNFDKFDNLMGSGLWDEIKNKIVNYTEFRMQLSDMVKHIREDIAVEKSMGAVLDKIFATVAPLIEKFSVADISEASIERASEQVLGKMEEFKKALEETPVKTRKKRTPKKELS